MIPARSGRGSAGREASSPPPASVSEPTPNRPPSAGVRIDLKLWEADAGKTIRLRCPESISAASLDRLIQAIRLHVRIED